MPRNVNPQKIVSQKLKCTYVCIRIQAPDGLKDRQLAILNKHTFVNRPLSRKKKKRNKNNKEEEVDVTEEEKEEEEERSTILHKGRVGVAERLWY